MSCRTDFLLFIAGSLTASDRYFALLAASPLDVDTLTSQSHLQRLEPFRHRDRASGPVGGIRRRLAHYAVKFFEQFRRCARPAIARLVFGQIQDSGCEWVLQKTVQSPRLKSLTVQALICPPQGLRRLFPWPRANGRTLSFVPDWSAQPTGGE